MSELKTAVEVAQALERGEDVEHQIIGDATWNKAKSDGWTWLPAQLIYRIKPKPLECWVNVYNLHGETKVSSYSTKEHATFTASPEAIRVAVHMREVT
jgi:hypothetical protein